MTLSVGLIILDLADIVTLDLCYDLVSDLIF